jgi:hypothetical protein
MKVKKRRNIVFYIIAVLIGVLLLLWFLSFYINKKVTLARETLLSVVSYATICVDDGLLLGGALDDNEIFTPEPDQALCQDAKVSWPTLPYGWKYLPTAKASIFKATFEYSAEGNGVTIVCTQAGCEESF